MAGVGADAGDACRPVALVGHGTTVRGGQCRDHVTVPRHRHATTGEPLGEGADPSTVAIDVDRGDACLPTDERAVGAEAEPSLVVEVQDISRVGLEQLPRPAAVGGPTARRRRVPVVIRGEREHGAVGQAHEDLPVRPIGRHLEHRVERRRPARTEHTGPFADDGVVRADDVQCTGDRRELQVGVLMDHVAVRRTDRVVDEARRLRDADDRHRIELHRSRWCADALGGERRRQRRIGDRDRTAVVPVGLQEFGAHGGDERLVLPHRVEQRRQGAERRHGHVPVARGDRVDRQRGDARLGGLRALPGGLHASDELVELAGIC